MRSRRSIKIEERKRTARPRANDLSARQAAAKVVQIAEARQASDIVVLSLKRVSSIADYFVICSGNSNTHMRTLAEHIEKGFAESGISLLNPRGFRNSRWILLDFGSTVVHIFSEDARSYYQLERVWSDAARESAADLAALSAAASS